MANQWMIGMSAVDARRASIAAAQRCVAAMVEVLDSAQAHPGLAPVRVLEIRRLYAELHAMQNTIGRMNPGAPRTYPRGAVWTMPGIVPTWRITDNALNVVYCTRNTHRVAQLYMMPGRDPSRMPPNNGATIPLTGIPIYHLYPLFVGTVNPASVGVFEFLNFIYGEEFVVLEFGAVGSRDRAMFAAHVSSAFGAVSTNRPLPAAGSVPPRYDALLIIFCYCNRVLYHARMALPPVRVGTA